MKNGKSPENPKRIHAVRSIADIIDLHNEVISDSQSIDDDYKRLSTILRATTGTLRAVDLAFKRGIKTENGDVPVLRLR